MVLLLAACGDAVGVSQEVVPALEATPEASEELFRLPDRIPETAGRRVAEFTLWARGSATNELALSKLQGKAAVLEFWATRCGPCLAAIPQWNNLVEEFKDEEILFLSVTDEPRETVVRSPERWTIRGWLASDTKRTVFDAYGVSAIPRAVLLDAKGNVRATVRPSDVDASVLRALIDGEDLPLKGSACSVDALSADSDSKEQRVPLLEVILREHYAVLFGVVVAPTFQERGIGWQLVSRLVQALEEEGVRDILLFAVSDTTSFYERLGFQRRSADAPGMLRRHGHQSLGQKAKGTDRRR